MVTAKNWRINFVLILVLIISAAIIGRLFFLQILNRKLYEAQALGQQSGFTDITGSRGQIFCENSQQSKGSQISDQKKNLAINRDTWTIVATPSDIKDKPAFAEILSKNISQTKDQILSELTAH